MKDKRMMNIQKNRDKRLSEQKESKRSEKAAKIEARLRAKKLRYKQKYQEMKERREKEREELGIAKKTKKQNTNKLDNFRNSSKENIDLSKDETSKNNLKVEMNSNVKIVKTENNVVLKDFVDFKNPLLEELDKENIDDEVEWIQNKDIKFVKEIPKFKKYGLQDDDDCMSDSPKNSQK